MTETVVPATRTARERVRAELTREIKDVARSHLAAEGAAALSLRAVARELGMASSAVYRYFPSRDALLTALIIDAYSSLGEAAETAEAVVRRGDLDGRWRAICRSVRDWAMENPHEYALIFGSPVPGYAAPQDTVGPATRVPNLLIALLADLPAASGRGPASSQPPLRPVPRRTAAALAPIIEMVPPEVPTDLVVRGLMAWTYLFGAVSFELFGHRVGVVLDGDAFFETEVARMGEFVGATRPPAGSRAGRVRRS